MYSPDGFASLACGLQNQCWFLGYQQPFVDLMLSLNQNVYLFFGLQILFWLLVISLIYFISKELKLKHLFITPIIFLFGGSFFVDNFVGSFENDNIGIFFILLAILFFIKFLNNDNKIFKNKKINFLTGIMFLFLSLYYWLWVGYLIRIPQFFSHITEVMFWANWFSWMFLIPLFILAIIQAYKHKTYFTIIVLGIILFIPKLFIFSTPFLLNFIDGVLTKMLKEENKRFYIYLFVFGLLLGQFIRVGYLTYESWNRQIENENCVTVNDEYFLRATKGLNYTYNQINTDEQQKCIAIYSTS